MSKVSIVRCEDYDSSRVYGAVKRSIDLLGGMRVFVKSGMKVLLKPNLLSARAPEEAVDTHPEVVRAVVRLVKEEGGKPYIGDSPGGYGKNINEVFEKSGMKKIAQEENVELVKFTASRFIDNIPIARHVFDCDCFISIPKLKTHIVTLITAAVKNTFGVVPGLSKAMCHSQAPTEESFAAVVAKIHSIAKPHLSVVDAIMAMEGDGPSSGERRRIEMILAGSDSVAIDSCIARIIGVEPLDVLVTKEAHALGLGETESSAIELLGDAIDSFAVKDFKLPQTRPLRYIPGALARMVASAIKFKPYIDEDICARCNLCKVSCPANCIEITNSRCRIDYKKCVRCMCCHEVCPYRAIGIRRNVLTRLVWG